MKKPNVYNIAQLSITIQALYRKINVHCFGGILPPAIITFEEGKKHKANGWTYSEKMWSTSKDKKYSIILASERLDNLTGTLITLTHEMCHLYANEKGIKDTSRRGYYHNDNFRDIAEAAGLICTKETQGWATRDAKPELLQWFEEQTQGLNIRIKWDAMPTLTTGKGTGTEAGTEGGGDEGTKPKKKSGYYVYVCPKCGATARTTKAGHILACMGTATQHHEPAMMQPKED